MPKKHLRLIAHSIAKFDLTKINTTLFDGIGTNTPASGGVLLIAKNKTQLFCLYTLFFVNTDFIAKQLAWMNSPYELILVNKSKLSENFNEEKKLFDDFLMRLDKSLAHLNLPLYQSCKREYFTSLVTVITFDGKVMEEFEKLDLQRLPFENARIAINTLNQLGAYKLSNDYADYEFDILFNEALDPSAMPKLTAQGYFLWDMLSSAADYYQIFAINPYINQRIKDLILSPFQSMPIKDYLKWYKEFMDIIIANAEKYTKKCTQYFGQKNFTEAVKNAEQALQNLTQLNQLHVEEQLSIGYYNLGSALLMQEQFIEAGQNLQKSKLLCIKLGKTERLEKIQPKLAEIQKVNRTKPLTFFDMPDDVIIQIISYLKPPDIARFARVSERASIIACSPVLWQKKLASDFTENYLPSQPKSYLKQYKEKYQRLPRNWATLDENQQLEIAFKLDAEVLVEQLVQAGAMLDQDYHSDIIAEVLKNGNKRLIELMLKNKLNVNEPIKRSFSLPFSIFHIAAFEAPELLPFLLKCAAKITILPALHVAVLQSDRKELEKLLTEKTDINTKDIFHLTALGWALLLNNYQMAEFLIKKGAAIDALKVRVPGISDYNVLFQLIKKGNYRCLELLLNEKLDVNTMTSTRDDYMTLLVVAAKTGQPDIIRLLLKHRAVINPNFDINVLSQMHDSLNAPDSSFSFSAAGIAAQNNQTECLAVLLDYVDVNELGIIYSMKDRKHHFVNRYPLLLVAVSNLAEQAVEFLLNRGADPNLAGIWCVRERALEADERKKYALAELLEITSYKLENELMQPGYDPNSQYSEKSRSWFNILDLLLKFDVDSIDKSDNKLFVSKIIEKPIFGTKEIHEDDRFYSQQTEILTDNQQRFIIEALKIMLKYKVNFEHQDNNGETILYYAAAQGYLKVVRYLIEEANVNINTQNQKSETAIFAAARDGHEKVYKYLQEAGSDSQAFNFQGETAEQLMTTSFVKNLRM